eukprot:scpid90592/ scgid7615/ 
MTSLSSTVRLVSATGAQIPVRGQLVLKTHLPDGTPLDITALVVEGITESLILGANSLVDHHITLAFTSTPCMIYADQKYTLHTPTTSTSSHITSEPPTSSFTTPALTPACAVPSAHPPQTTSPVPTTHDAPHYTPIHHLFQWQYFASTTSER